MAKKKKVNLAEEARKSGIPYTVLQARVHKLGWSLARATSTPVRPRKAQQSTSVEDAPGEATTTVTSVEDAPGEATTTVTSVAAAPGEATTTVSQEQLDGLTNRVEFHHKLAIGGIMIVCVGLIVLLMSR
jgi:uncharacterized iron-regulated membrane protein